MIRVQALRAGVALAAILVGAASAQARSTLPPADVTDAQSAPTEETTDADEIVVTGSRIRRDPLSQDSPIVFVDEDDIKKSA
jgi:iron complex outermembrane receptor protein